MSSLDHVIEKAVENGGVPFVCAGVTDASGIRWQGSAGFSSAGHAAGNDTVFRLFSGTKAIGGLAALIAIERGLLSIDTPVGDILPGFDKLQVLTAVTADGPVFRPARTRATLRHILTHTQGQSYDIFAPLMLEYAAHTRAPNDLSGLWESLNYPLLFDPGDGFAYGIGPDWVGAMVAAVDGRPIEKFVQEEILDPLGMRNTVFETGSLAEGQLANVYRKDASGEFESIEHGPPVRPELYHMGHALYGSADDYLRFLQCLLNEGEFEGGRLVSLPTLELAFTSQTAGAAVPSPVLSSLLPAVCRDVDILPSTPFTHTALSFMNLEDAPGRRRAGSLSWGGVLHTLYWLDPRSRLAGVFFTQMLPFWDPSLIAAFEAFERATYVELEVSSH